MLIISGKPLPVGKIYDPRAMSRRAASMCLTGRHGEAQQPFLVMRKLTLDEYSALFEAENGRPISAIEYSHDVRPGKNHYYDVSVD